MDVHDLPTRAVVTPSMSHPVEWLVNGGVMGELIRTTNWSGTSLGPRDRWPASLRTAVGIVVESQIPMALVWGVELVLLYNDAYRVIVADEHPRALGRSIRESQAELWRVHEPLLAAVLDHGEPTMREDELLPILRDGRREDAYFTRCYGPIRGEDGAVAGALVTLFETTRRVRQHQALAREREQAEETARREHELFGRVVDRIPVMVVTYDPALRSFHLNEELHRVLGWTEEDARSGDLMALCYPDEQYRREMQTFMAEAEPSWREVVVTAKDGTKVVSAWANVRSSDDTRVGIGIDLRERKRAEQALRDSEEQLRALYDQNPAMVVLSDMEDGRIIQANQSFTHMLGFTIEEVLGRTPVELGIFPRLEDRQRIIDVVRASGSVRSLEITMRAKSGAAITGLLSSTVIHIGGRDRLITVVADISARKRIEEALHESERLHRLAGEASQLAARLPAADELVAAVGELVATELGVSRCGFSRVDLEARCVTVMKDYHGDWPSIAGAYPISSYMEHWEADGLAGRVAALEDIAAHPRTAALYDTAFGPIHVRAHLTVPLHRDGKWVANFWASHHEPRRWTDAEIQLMKLVAERIWALIERKWAEEALQRANEQLRESDRRKNDFLAVLSHELRNPLSPIRNSVYVLEHAAVGGEQARRAIQVIDRQARHMARLIDDLLDVTRISRGMVDLRRERVDLDALVRGAAEDHREHFARSGITLELEAAAQPLWVEGDPTRLAQVVGNLLHNAAKFTPRGGRTILSIEASAHGEAVVRVRDDGVGMSPETLARIFEPFVQAAQTLERTRGGLGLGLALVKGLVEMHGGTVTAHSQGEGMGSELTVALPLQVPARLGPTAGAARSPRTPAQRVLVIEDNVDAAESLREVLALEGHEIFVARAGPEGLARARELEPHVVLCDIGLPGMDGYAVARALRSDPNPAVRAAFLVALSGYALQEDVARAQAAGFDRHMAKPPSIEALGQLLQETASALTTSAGALPDLRHRLG